MKTSLSKREKQDRDRRQRAAASPHCPAGCQEHGPLQDCPPSCKSSPSFHPPAVVALVHPDPDFVSLVLLQSFHLTFVKKKICVQLVSSSSVPGCVLDTGIEQDT